MQINSEFRNFISFNPMIQTEYSILWCIHSYADADPWLFSFSFVYFVYEINSFYVADDVVRFLSSSVRAKVVLFFNQLWLSHSHPSSANVKINVFD